MKYLIVSGILFTPGLLLANNLVVPAQGVVTSSCTFVSNTPGVLIAQANNGQYIIDAGFTNSNNAAHLGINYTGTPTIELTSVTSFTTSPAGNSPANFSTGLSFQGGGASTINNQSSIEAGGNNFSSGSVSVILSDNDTADTALISMKAVSSTPWKTGQYAAQTTITCN